MMVSSSTRPCCMCRVGMWTCMMPKLRLLLLPLFPTFKERLLHRDGGLSCDKAGLPHNLAVLSYLHLLDLARVVVTLTAFHDVWYLGCFFPRYDNSQNSVWAIFHKRPKTKHKMAVETVPR